MILYPAIDLKDGQCVRLVKGDMARATVFNADPAAQARLFEGAGFSHLHLVDLNGAIEGRPVNGSAITAILDAVQMTTQLGGGIRDEATVASWLERGIDRVILGTLALQQPETARALCKRYPGRIAIAIDARQGRVAAEGWVQQTEVAAIDLARAFEDAGAAAIIYTDIERDGVMGGVNAAQTAALAPLPTGPSPPGRPIPAARDGLASAAPSRRCRAFAPADGCRAAPAFRARGPAPGAPPGAFPSR